MRMELDDCIKGRRSVREYLDAPVEKGKIDKILAAGAMAPTARNSQQCRFTVVESKGKVRELSDAAKKNLGLLGRGVELASLITSREDRIFYGAPLLIVVSASKGDKWAHIDCGICAQTMMLAAYDLGLGSCYIGFANSLNNDKRICTELGLPDDYEIVAPIIFGYPKSWPEAKKRKPQILKRIT